PSTRSPFCAPIASVISPSRNSSITVRTIGRRKSPSSAIIALISLVVLLLFFRVMVRYSVGCYLLPTAYHVLSLIAEPSGRYPCFEAEGFVDRGESLLRLDGDVEVNAGG